MRIESMHIYPVKSMRGIPVERTILTASGLLATAASWSSIRTASSSPSAKMSRTRADRGAAAGGLSAAA